MTFSVKVTTATAKDINTLKLNFNTWITEVQAYCDVWRSLRGTRIRILWSDCHLSTGDEAENVKKDKWQQIRRAHANEDKMPAWQGKQRAKRAAATAERTIRSGVSPCAHLDPFLRLLKRGVCGRLGRRVMLMRRSDACNRTCHWRGGSALQLLKPLETCACVIFFFFKGGQLVATLFRQNQPWADSVSPLSRHQRRLVGVAAAAAAPARANEPVPALR